MPNLLKLTKKERRAERKMQKLLFGNYLPKISYSLRYYLDDKCQFWLNDSAKILTSPYFDGINQRYSHNLNCTWMLKAEKGFYVNFEMEYFLVNKNTR